MITGSVLKSGNLKQQLENALQDLHSTCIIAVKPWRAPLAKCHSLLCGFLVENLPFYNGLIHTVEFTKLHKQSPGPGSSNKSTLKWTVRSQGEQSLWYRGLIEEKEQTERGPDQIISQCQRYGTVCVRFFIFLVMKRLAECLALNAAPWCSGYWIAPSQINSAFWGHCPFHFLCCIIGMSWE